MPENEDRDMITIKTITSTFAAKATEVDPEQLQEAMKLLADAVEKRMNEEIVKALGVPPSVIQSDKPATYNALKDALRLQRIRIERDPEFDKRMEELNRLSWSRYAWNIGSYPRRKPVKPKHRTTTRKDGREQQTCTCGVVAYPHRYKSVDGCDE